MFPGKTSGYIYRFTGTVPADQNVTAYVTGKFVEATGDNITSTVVVEVQNSIIIYVDWPEDKMNSADFELLADLVPEPEPVVEPTPAEEPAPEGQ